MYFIHCLFVTLLISSCHHSYYQRILIYSQRARAYIIWPVDAIYSQRARARAGSMHMQIIVVGVTNRRDQQKARFIAFVVPFGQP